ncbi:MAG: hypothetical protein KC416_14140, partial [Myxococcales bacterium]|nr:hypothetical protein [Myxococcales bacterium]
MMRLPTLVRLVALVLVAMGGCADSKDPKSLFEGGIGPGREAASDGSTDGSSDGAQNGLPKLPEPPAKLITTKGGRFFDDGEPWQPVGVNYIYPLYSQPFHFHNTWDWVTAWDSPEFPEIDAEAEIAADLTRMHANGVNEIRLFNPHATVTAGNDPANYPSKERSFCARLTRVLELAGERGIHVALILPFGTGPLPVDNFSVAASQAAAQQRMDFPGRVIDACGLASRSEIAGYLVDGEGEVEPPTPAKFKKRGEPVAVGLWNDWLTERYGSPARAQQKWGETLRKECLEPEGTAAGNPVTNACPDLDAWDAGCEKRGTRVCPPRLDAHGNGTPYWGADSNARRAFVRFTDWVMNKRFQRLREILKRHDPYHLFGTDSVLQDGFCSNDIFLRREQTMYLDYSGVHVYHHQYMPGAHWTVANYGVGQSFESLKSTAAAIAWMNPTRRAVVIGEVGVSVLGDCKPGEFCVEGSAAARGQVQALHVPFEAAIAATGGAQGLRWWWWRGQRPMGTYPNPAKPRDVEVSDYGMLEPDTGNLRPTLAALGR